MVSCGCRRGSSRRPSTTTNIPSQRPVHPWQARRASDDPPSHQPSAARGDGPHRTRPRQPGCPCFGPRRPRPSIAAANTTGVASSPGRRSAQSGARRGRQPAKAPGCSRAAARPLYTDHAALRVSCAPLLRDRSPSRTSGFSHQRRRRRSPDRRGRVVGAVPCALRAPRIRTGTCRARHLQARRRASAAVDPPSRQAAGGGSSRTFSSETARACSLRSWMRSTSDCGHGDAAPAGSIAETSTNWPPTFQGTTFPSARWPTHLKTTIRPQRSSMARGSRAKVNTCALFGCRPLPSTRHANSKRC